MTTRSSSGAASASSRDRLGELQRRRKGSHRSGRDNGNRDRSGIRLDQHRGRSGSGGRLDDLDIVVLATVLETESPRGRLEAVTEQDLDLAEKSVGSRDSSEDFVKTAIELLMGEVGAEPILVRLGLEANIVDDASGTGTPLARGRGGTGAIGRLRAISGLRTLPDGVPNRLLLGGGLDKPG